MGKLLVSRALLGVLVVSGAGAQIPPGYEIVHITDNPNDYSSVPKINNCGQIVFDTWINQGPGEIFLYDNGDLVKITDDSVHDVWADINDLGAIVWSRAVGQGNTYEVATYSEGSISILTWNELDDVSPQINNLGHVAWNQFTEGECTAAEIFFYDGESIEQITSNGFSNQSEKLNDNDVIIWNQRDYCASPSDYRIMMYADGMIQELTDGQLSPRVPHINNWGQVVWQFSVAPGEHALELWENGATILLTDWGSNPRLNDVGDMYFIRWHDDTSTWQAWLCVDCNLHGKGDPTFVQLTDDPFWNTSGDINDYGEVVWQARNYPESNIYFLRRIRDGDADFDLDVDLDDFAMLAGCITGPVEGNRLCECRFLDLDHDRDVDMDDYLMFQTNFTGPE